MMYITEENVNTLTRAEARAFILFLLCEAGRHQKDILDIRKTVKLTREAFDIRGLELAAIYTKAGGGSRPCSGVKNE